MSDLAALAALINKLSGPPMARSPGDRWVLAFFDDGDIQGNCVQLQNKAGRVVLMMPSADYEEMTGERATDLPVVRGVVI